jgi:chromosome segregation protein
LAQRAEQLRAAEAERDEVAQRREALLLERAVVQERAERLREAMERDRREVEDAERQRVELQAEETRLTTQRDQIEAEAASVQERLTVLEQELDGFEAQERTSGAGVADLETEAEGMIARQQSVQEQLAAARTEEAETRAEEERVRGLLARLEVELGGAAEALSVEPDRLMKRPVDPLLEALDEETLQRRFARSQRDLRSVGAVDYTVLADYAKLSDRHRSLVEQLSDLSQTDAAIREGMDEVRQQIREKFLGAFEEVSRQFRETFHGLFGGGDAELMLSGEPDSPDCGIEIVAQPPGKRLHRLATLSGGERALVGAALLLALIGTHPSPFCLLDEVDAALDDANVQRFLGQIREMSARTQFVLVTHNRSTMEMADALYGVTMSGSAVSQVVAVRLPL